jgi:hypothetical protein
MFFLLRVIIVVAVVFLLSPVREDRHGPSLDAPGLSTLAGAFWPVAARWWSAVPEPVRDGIAQQALDRLSRAEPTPPQPEPRSLAEKPRSEHDRAQGAHRAAPTR